MKIIFAKFDEETYIAVKIVSRHSEELIFNGAKSYEKKLREKFTSINFLDQNRFNFKDKEDEAFFLLMNSDGVEL